MLGGRDFCPLANGLFPPKGKLLAMPLTNHSVFWGSLTTGLCFPGGLWRVVGGPCFHSDY